MYQFRIMIKVLLLCLCMVACNDNDKGDSIIPSEQEPEIGVSSDYTKLLNKTTPVPSEYNQEFALKGSVVQIDYDWILIGDFCVSLFPLFAMLKLRVVITPQISFVFPKQETKTSNKNTSKMRFFEN